MSKSKPAPVQPGQSAEAHRPQELHYGSDDKFTRKLSTLLRASYRILFIPTAERDRAELEIETVARGMKNPYHVAIWDCHQGFVVNGTDKKGASAEEREQYKQPIAALDFVLRQDAFPPATIVIMRNLDDYLVEPRVRQRLETFAQIGMDNPQVLRTIIIVSAKDIVHDKLKPMITMLNLSLPDEGKLRKIVDGNVASAERQGAENGCPESLRDKLATSLLGCNALQAENILASVAIEERCKYSEEMVLKIQAEKASIIKSDGILNFIDRGRLARSEDIGGYSELIRWLTRAKQAYTPEAAAIKLDFPKGIVLVGPPGTGKCLGRGTPVLMYDGTTRAVEDIEEGDLVMGPDSKPRRVSGVTAGHGPLYRVTPRRGDPYVVNEHHVLSLKMSPTEPGQSHKLQNVSIAEYLRSSNTFKHHAKGWRAGVTWPAKPVRIPPYILGAWLGDGAKKECGVTTMDLEVETAFREYAQAVGCSVTVHDKPGTPANYYRVAGKHGGNAADRGDFAYTALEHYGLLNNKHIPHDYIANSRETRLELLAGLIDTDGYLTCKCYEIVSKYEKLAEDIVFLARSLGFAASIQVSMKTCTNNGKRGRYYRVFIAGNIDEIPVRIPRRKAEKRVQKKNHLVTGITVEPIGDGDYYGFEVDRDHLFLLGDFTVTHNSLVAKTCGVILDLPVFMFNVAAVFGHLVGESETRMRTALSQIEAVKGSVVILDEADKALAGAKDSSGDTSGVTRRVFGQFLTWLAEKQDRTFVILTLNRTTGLDPELLRAGRFDDMFYTDLPTPSERRQILDIHFRKRGLETAALGIPEGQWKTIYEDTTDKFVGSELEQVVINARQIAFADGRRSVPTFDDIVQAASEVTPLAVRDENAVTSIRDFCKKSGGRSVSGATSVREIPQRRRGRGLDLEGAPTGELS